MPESQTLPIWRRHIVSTAPCVVAIAAALAGYCAYRHHQWSESIAQFETHGGSIEYESIAPQWLRNVAGSSLLDKIPFVRRSTGQYLPSVELSPDGLHFVSHAVFAHEAFVHGVSANEFFVWRIGDAKPLFCVGEAAYGCAIIGFSPDGNLLAIQRYHDDGFDGSARDDVQLWSVPEGKLVGTIEGEAIQRGDTYFHPDGKTLAVSFEAAENDYELHLWNVDPLKRCQTFIGHQRPVQGVAISPDGRGIVSVAFNIHHWTEARAELRLWDRATGRLRYSHETPGFPSAEYSPDGKKLLVWGRKKVSLRDAANGRVVCAIESLDTLGPSRAKTGVFLSDGTVVVASHYPWPARDRSFEFVDLNSGEKWEPLKNIGEECRAFDVTTDGRLFVAVLADGSIKLWDVAQRTLNTLTGHDDWAAAVDFSDDSTLLAAGCRSGSVKVWDVARGMSKTFPGHDHPATWVGFVNNGQFLVSIGGGRAKVWDLSKGIECATLVGTRFGELSPDGKIVKTGRMQVGESSSTLWDFPSGKPHPYVSW